MLILLLQTGLMLPAMNDERRQPNQIIPDPISGLVRELEPSLKAVDKGLASVKEEMARWKLYWRLLRYRIRAREYEKRVRQLEEKLREMNDRGHFEQRMPPVDRLWLEEFNRRFDERMRKQPRGPGIDA